MCLIGRVHVTFDVLSCSHPGLLEVLAGRHIGCNIEKRYPSLLWSEHDLMSFICKRNDSLPARTLYCKST